MKLIKNQKKNYKNIFGFYEKPRVSVFRSNKHIYAQIINDNIGITITCASSIEKMKNKKFKKMDKAMEVGIILGERIKKCGIKKVVFDRNGYLYHGRIKALAEGLRKRGIKF